MDLEDLEIIVGTYEEFLLGYQVFQQENEEYELIQSFATHSHRASVRSVAAGGKYVASGGTDESIFLYDMTTRKEVGLLMQHHGTISCLEFAPNGTHLVSGSEDGSIGASRTGNWQLEKLWGKAHKGSAVTSVSIHPSGKLFLSLGADGTVRTWNFVKGRPAYTTHLSKVKDGRSVTQVLWSPSGETYSVLIGNRVEVFSVTGASIVYTIQLDSKITCISYVDSNIVCVASEDGRIFLYDVQEKKVIGEFQAHEGRVRCATSFKLDHLVTASSSGEIKLWCIKDPKEVVELCVISTGCRITCMTLVNIKNSSDHSQLRLLKQMNLTGTKVDLDAEIAAKSNQNARRLGVVTVEVDKPNREAKIGKEKKRKSRDDTTLAKSTNEKHKKKKKRDMTGPLNGQGPVDTSDDEAKNTSLNTKIRKKKKKIQRIEKVEDETVSNKDRNTRRKVKDTSEEVGVMSVERKNKKSPRVKDSQGETPAGKDKNSKRKRKEQIWEEVDVTSAPKRSGENLLKKSKKQKTVGSNSINSPSGKWVTE